MASNLAQHQYRQALDAAEAGAAGDAEKVDMLMEMAMGLQQRPKNRQQLLDAIALYERAERLCAESPQLKPDPLLLARVRARKGTAWQAVPSADAGNLRKALICFEAALETLSVAQSTAAEAAEVEMNRGLSLQSLAAFHQAPIADAIAAYQRALRVFTKDKHPTEFAILHNNLATAFLSMPMTDERGKMREALAVQSFESALQVVTLVDHPAEYAMLQNNLGNALQYASTSHAMENNYRALQAYDEALKVRTLADTPQEYANTIANKANCLMNLPDDPQHPAGGNRANLHAARDLYAQARRVFKRHGEFGKCQVADEALSEIAALLGNGAAAADGAAHAFGESRVN